MKRSVLSFSIVVCLAACSPQPAPQTANEPVVAELIALLETRPDLSDSLTEAIETASLEGIEDLDAFYGYVNELVTWIPVERELVPRAIKFHYSIGQAPGDALNQDAAFSDWMGHVAEAWGEFLDTPASAGGIGTFTALPGVNIDDYSSGPSGWQTFNQFFAREIRPGKRPIADPHDDDVVVSPADSIFMGSWPIDEDSQITVKGAEWSIADLLADSPYADAFSNGIYTHMFLGITDYHRYHAPVGGIVREVRNVHGRVYLDVVKKPDGTLGTVRGDAFQFNQERGLVVIDSPVLGLVAVLPVGMTFISSVNLTPQDGAELSKGEQFGYFQFGGSDIVMLFQDKNVTLEAEVGTKYLQGQRIGAMDRKN